VISQHRDTVICCSLSCLGEKIHFPSLFPTMSQKYENRPLFLCLSELKQQSKCALFMFCSAQTAKIEWGILKPPPERNELWERKWLIETDTNQPPTWAETCRNTHTHTHLRSLLGQLFTINSHGSAQRDWSLIFFTVFFGCFKSERMIYSSPDLH